MTRIYKHVKVLQRDPVFRLKIVLKLANKVCYCSPSSHPSTHPSTNFLHFWGPHTGIFPLLRNCESLFTSGLCRYTGDTQHGLAADGNHRFDYQIQSDLRYPNKHTTITRGRGQGHTTLAPTLKKKPCKSTCDLQVTRTHHTQNIYNGVPGVSSATCRVQKTMH